MTCAVVGGFSRLLAADGEGSAGGSQRQAAARRLTHHLSVLVNADAQRVDGDAHLDEEHEERRGQAHHRGHEHDGDDAAHADMRVNSLANSSVTTSVVSSAEMVHSAMALLM